jgi:uncharacterized protein (DUF169 family)
MDIKLKQDFIVLWKRFFGEAELPIAFYYTNEEGHAELMKPRTIRRCVFTALSLVRKGRALCFDAESIDCSGGKKSLGFCETEEPDIEYFLSCGIPGKVKGERYKKTPEIAAEALKLMPSFKAPARFIVFKRWDSLNESDEPAVVIFFACPDVLSGLFSLANSEET